MMCDRNGGVAGMLVSLCVLVACQGGSAVPGWHAARPAGQALERRVPQRAARVAAVSAGGDSTCVVVQGEVWCWGAVLGGQSASSVHAHRVDGLDGVEQLSVGGEHACALRRGEVWCWGSNRRGQLGVVGMRASERPHRVTGLPKGVRKVRAGGEHTCAVLADHRVACWGDNTRGALGDGSLESHVQPVRVVGLRDVMDVALGQHHSCAVTRAGEVWCWGGNQGYQLGDGTQLDRPVTVLVQHLNDAHRVSAGAMMGCALLEGGRVKCWGAVNFGLFGPSVNATTLFPARVPRVREMRSVVSGRDHVCAHDGQGRVVCWGANNAGQLGRPPTGEGGVAYGADVVIGVGDVEQVATGSHHSCALTRMGVVWCWGRNARGQLGVGPRTLFRWSPQPVALPGALDETFRSEADVKDDLGLNAEGVEER